MSRSTSTVQRSQLSQDFGRQQQQRQRRNLTQDALTPLPASKSVPYKHHGVDMQTVPIGWTSNDVQRFTAFQDGLNAYQQLDYVRGKVGASLPTALANFLQARQADIANTVKAQAQFFMDNFNQD